eukprot:gnl/MRDRNA2_/MRDRNA2_68247_c0_seq1.p1 gnl/MRDRNA2_/MRDRNA2_68247_c0~~gnl/MRDRNA2_/MRDRNA2_68247_c0_seq1.p1  ORF type:complete len:106 (+),score=28.46 gnl/MRDRNA2_/MRDRNA2_68247_c0_seq1:163-480(+)
MSPEMYQIKFNTLNERYFRTESEVAAAKKKVVLSKEENIIAQEASHRAKEKLEAAQEKAKQEALAAVAAAAASALENRTEMNSTVMSRKSRWANFDEDGPFDGPT